MSNPAPLAAALAALTPSVQDVVRAAARPLHASRGAVLVEKGDALSEVFLVTDGALRIYATNAEGKEATLYRLRPGELCLLSLNAAFTGRRYPANVTVESPEADVSRIPSEVLRRLFREEPAVQDLVLASLTAVVDELLVRLDEVLLSPLKHRLRSYLAERADSGGRVFATHQVLADGLGVTRESVSREIQRLKRAGVVRTARGCTTFLRDP